MVALSTMPGNLGKALGLTVEKPMFSIKSINECEKRIILFSQK